jgi:hypothetical protein
VPEHGVDVEDEDAVGGQRAERIAIRGDGGLGLVSFEGGGAVGEDAQRIRPVEHHAQAFARVGDPAIPGERGDVRDGHRSPAAGPDPDQQVLSAGDAGQRSGREDLTDAVRRQGEASCPDAEHDGLLRPSFADRRRRHGERRGSAAQEVLVITADLRDGVVDLSHGRLVP